MLPLLEIPAINYFGHLFFADQLFGGLPKTPSHSLSAFKQLIVFPPNSTIIEEKQNVCGIYILRKGKARVEINLFSGKTKAERKVEKNEMLGLCAIISDSPSEITVKTITQCQMDFISRDDFFRLISEEKMVRDRLVHVLSDVLHCTYSDLRNSMHSRMSKKHFHAAQTKRNKSC